MKLSADGCLYATSIVIALVCLALWVLALRRVLKKIEPRRRSPVKRDVADGCLYATSIVIALVCLVLWVLACLGVIS